jgi:cytochrome c556
MDRRRTLLLTIALVAVSTWVATRPFASESDKPAPRVHLDAEAMARAVVETMDALMRDDAEAVRAPVKRIEESCRRLHAEDDDDFAPGFRNLDQALHKVLTGTRAYAAAGDVDEAFTEFVWVLRSCRQCHEYARQKGFLPSEGPLWESVTAPTDHVETTHSGNESP